MSSRGVASAPASARKTAPNLYKRLQVEASATPEEIKAAYRRRALECHPDVVESHQRAQAEVQFRGVSEAYEVLSDPERRRAHDKSLGIDPEPLTTPTNARGASAADAKPTASSSAHSNRGARAAAWKKPFVRADADRLFAEAFDGKTVEQLLFEARRRRRLREGSPGDDDDRARPSSAAEEAFLHAIEHAAARIERSYGPSILRHLHVRSSLPRGPVRPPATRMPFRPFLNQKVPEGVTTPPTPRVDPVDLSMHPEMEVIVPDPKAEREREREEARLHPKHLYTPKLPGGVELTRMQGLDRVKKTIMGAAHNMGVLYSYHRPY
ncbi:unnamed protein product [Phytomonas sp. EM1]|nr:unnamed protein product [Phytomonas sp. EM1]|eukprot:CCW61689.1 unnamed protein product [Phytomonas sp. isolate EM1]